MRASLSRRGLPALALACTLALAFAPPSLAATWSAASAPPAVTAAGSSDWLSWVGSWLRAMWPGGGTVSDLGQHGATTGPGKGAGAARPQAGCGSDSNGQNCGTGAGAARPQCGLGSDPSGQNCGNSPPRTTTTGGLRRGDGRR
jgi:hypothetical protein